MKCNLCKKELIEKEIVSDNECSTYRFAITFNSLPDYTNKYYLCERCWDEFITLESSLQYSRIDKKL